MFSTTNPSIGSIVPLPPLYTAAGLWLWFAWQHDLDWRLPWLWLAGR